MCYINRLYIQLGKNIYSRIERYTENKYYCIISSIGILNLKIKK